MDELFSSFKTPVLSRNESTPKSDFANLKNYFLPGILSWRSKNFFLHWILSKDHRFSTESSHSVPNLRSRLHFAHQRTIVELHFETNSPENELVVWCSCALSCTLATLFRAAFLCILRVGSGHAWFLDIR